jgi:hypothetical protein
MRKSEEGIIKHALNSIEKSISYLEHDDTVVCVKRNHKTTTQEYERDGEYIHPITVQAGSPLAGIYAARDVLTALLEG